MCETKEENFLFTVIYVLNFKMSAKVVFALESFGISPDLERFGIGVNDDDKSSIQWRGFLSDCVLIYDLLSN